MPRATQKQLGWLAELHQERLANFKAGASLVQRTGYSIDELIAKATIDRVRLGEHFEDQAAKLLRLRPPPYRAVIGRAYYSLYQSFRAVVFFIEKGDDFEKHSELPKHIPNDFPAPTHWKGVLKTARLQRNRADYEPYPRSDRDFGPVAKWAVSHAQALRPVVRKYLRGKGVHV